MPFDQILAKRIRDELSNISGIVEKKKFGGVGFLIRGNMACGVHKEDLIVRVGSAGYAEALTHPQVRPFDMTGKPMAGWIMVFPGGLATDDDLKSWIRQGVEFAQTLPTK
jgi:TfoX/Sxy family transcriptional regulator of competence genes